MDPTLRKEVKITVMFDSLKEKAGQATSSNFPIVTKVYLAENDSENLLELEHLNGDVYALSNVNISKAHHPVLGIIDIERTRQVVVAFGATDTTKIIHRAKYLIETTEDLRIMLSIILGEPMYKVERVIY